MIPDGYVLPLVEGDLMVDLPQGILFVRLIEASLSCCFDVHASKDWRHGLPAMSGR
jgi:hypothetical protein